MLVSDLRRVEFERFWASLWTRPERSTCGGLLIWREIVKKLENGGHIVLFESVAGPFDAVIEVIWFLVDEEVNDSLGSGDWLIAGQLLSFCDKVGGIGKILFRGASLSSKQSFKVISRPLKTVLLSPKGSLMIPEGNARWHLGNFSKYRWE